MNIFEFFGLKPDHRKHPVQLVKHWDEVPESKKVKYYLAQEKKDGVYEAVCIFNGAVGIFGRTGLKLHNTELLEASIKRHNDYHTKGTTEGDGVYIAELVAYNCSLEELSGIVNPNRVNALDESQESIKSTFELCYHDYLTPDEFIEGVSSSKYASRLNELRATFASGSVIITEMLDASEVDAFADYFINLGGEGAVFKDPEARWVAGHKGCHAMKKVRDVRIDLVCTGYEEGKGKYKGKVANLLFALEDGRIFKAMLGKGYTHFDAEKMFLSITETGICSPIGKTFTIYGLQPSSKGGLIRLPKVGELRHDKIEPDFQPKF